MDRLLKPEHGELLDGYSEGHGSWHGTTYCYVYGDDDEGFGKFCYSDGTPYFYQIQYNADKENPFKDKWDFLCVRPEGDYTECDDAEFTPEQKEILMSYLKENCLTNEYEVLTAHDLYDDVIKNICDQLREGYHLTDDTLANLSVGDVFGETIIGTRAILFEVVEKDDKPQICVRFDDYLEETNEIILTEQGYLYCDIKDIALRKAIEQIIQNNLPLIMEEVGNGHSSAKGEHSLKTEKELEER